MSFIRQRPPIIPSQTGEGKGIAKPKRHVSQEGRERLSELARERHRNGGFKKQGAKKKRKPSRRRVAQLVAEAARERKNAEAIVEVFKDGVASGQPMPIRIKAAEAWLKVETEDAKFQLREAEAEGQRRDREELLDVLSQSLTSGHAALALRKQLEERSGIIDGSLVEE